MTIGWREELRLNLEKMAASFVAKGATLEDVCDAIEQEAGRLLAGTAIGRGSSSDRGGEMEEPSNDWPAAQR